MRIGIIGCGNIATPYARDLVTYPDLTLAALTDLDPARAAALAENYGGQVYPDLTTMLAEADLDLVVNLTFQRAHQEVTTTCLEAGKHVWSEKPLAMTYAGARQLVELAGRKGLRLGCSPFTYLGAAQQTASQWLREGRLGTVRAAYAEVNWGRIESWHPAPEAFYETGPLYDVGVYALTLLTAFLGPAQRVWAYGRILWPERVTKDGRSFAVTAPDYVVLFVEFGQHLVARVTANFYVTPSTPQQGIEFHGDFGSLHLSSWLIPEATVSFGEFGQPLAPVPLVREPDKGLRWGTGIHEMAQAIRAGRPHRATGLHAAHVVEIMEAAVQSIASGAPVELNSTFPLPAPM